MPSKVRFMKAKQCYCNGWNIYTHTICTIIKRCSTLKYLFQSLICLYNDIMLKCRKLLLYKWIWNVNSEQFQVLYKQFFSRNSRSKQCCYYASIRHHVNVYIYEKCLYESRIIYCKYVIYSDIYSAFRAPNFPFNLMDIHCRIRRIDEPTDRFSRTTRIYSEGVLKFAETVLRFRDKKEI